MNTSVHQAALVPPRLQYPNAALTLLSFSQLLIALDATIVFVALDAMGSHLAMSAQHLQWIISAYSVAFGGCLLMGGRCADLLGRRRMYVAGMSVFALASFLGGLAHDSWQLIAARAGQGLGAAILFPATLSLINNIYAEGAERNRALAIWSMASAGGLAAGALLGGLLTQWLGWNWVLWVMVPVALPCALLATRYLPRDSDGVHRGSGFDLGGCVTVTLGSTLLVTALVQGPEWGWTSARLAWMLALALVLLAVFVRIELTTREPLMPLSLLRVPGLRAAMALTMAFMSSYGVQYYFLALCFQQVFGWSPLQAGLAFIMPTIVCTAGIRMAERMLARTAVRHVLLTGWAMGAFGLAWIAWTLPLAANYAWLVPGLIVQSLGQGVSWTAMWIVAGQNIPPHQQGVSSGIAATAQQVGAAVGLAVLVMISTAPLTGVAEGGDLLAARLRGLQHAEWGAVAFALLGLLVAWRMGDAQPRAEDVVSRVGDGATCAD